MCKMIQDFCVREAVRCSMSQLSAFVHSSVKESAWLRVCVQYGIAVFHSSEHFGAFE